MGLLCAILICVGGWVSLAIPDQRASTTAEDVIITSSPVIEQLLERMDMLGVKQFKEIQSLKAEMSQQASEIQSLKAEMSQQASEIQSLKAEMSQQASEIQSLKAEMSQQASEIQSLKAEMSQQASEIQSLKAEMSQQASGIQSLKAEMSQQASEIQSLKAEMSQQASETQSLKAEMSQQASEIQSLKAEMSQQASEIQSLKAEMSQQASEIQSLKAEMSQQASGIQSLKAEMSQQASETQSLKAEMSQQASETQSLKAEMSQQVSEIQLLKADMSHQITYVKRIRSKLYTKNMLIQRLLSGTIKPTKGTDLPGSEIVGPLSSETTIVPEGKQQTQDIRDTGKRIIPVENIPVAFFASLTHPLSLDDIHHNIVFDHVETNVGNAYNSSSGDFIAPVPGIYVFSTTLLSDDSAYTQDLLYTVNRYAKSRLYINPNQREMVSKTVVFQLNKGDRVAIFGAYVRLREVVLKKLNTFSGFLLHQTTTSTLPVVG